MFGMQTLGLLTCSVFLLDANQPEFTSLHQKEERQCGAEASEMDRWNLISEECK